MECQFLQRHAVGWNVNFCEDQKKSVFKKDFTFFFPFLFHNCRKNVLGCFFPSLKVTFCSPYFMVYNALHSFASHCINSDGENS